MAVDKKYDGIEDGNKITIESNAIENKIGFNLKNNEEEILNEKENCIWIKFGHGGCYVGWL